MRIFKNNRVDEDPEETGNELAVGVVCGVGYVITAFLLVVMSDIPSKVAFNVIEVINLAFLAAGYVSFVRDRLKRAESWLEVFLGLACGVVLVLLTAVFHYGLRLDLLEY